MHGNFVSFAGLERLREDYSEIRIFIFVFLDEIQIPALFILDPAHAQSGKKIHGYDPNTRRERPEGNPVSSGESRSFDGRVDLVVSHIHEPVILGTGRSTFLILVVQVKRGPETSVRRTVPP